MSLACILEDLIVQVLVEEQIVVQYQGKPVD